MKDIKLKINNQNTNDFIYIPEKKLLTSDQDRFFNCIIDLIFILVIIFVFTLLVVITGNILHWDIYRMWEKILINLGFVGTYFSFAIVYYVVFEGFFGRTFGKIITGSIVVNEYGLKPGFVVIFKRTLCRLIPFDALSFLGKSGRIWHDSLSKTYVVNRKDLKEEIKLFSDLNLIGNNELN